MLIRLFAALALSVAIAPISTPAASQKKPLTPAETVVDFYRLLREQRYAEGFALSIYREAVDGLSAEDLAELTPDFEATFTQIPAKIQIKGEQSAGETATVFALFGDDDEVQEVSLVREEGRWLVGDAESLELVRHDKKAFFFNTRIRVNHNEAFAVLKRIIGTETIRLKEKKAYGTLEELLAEEKTLGTDIPGGVGTGYRFVVNLTPDRQAFTIAAVPVKHGRTGRLSFYADSGGIHAADAGGLAVNETAPLLEQSQLESAAP